MEVSSIFPIDHVPWCTVGWKPQCQPQQIQQNTQTTPVFPSNSTTLELKPCSFPTNLGSFNRSRTVSMTESNSDDSSSPPRDPAHLDQDGQWKDKFTIKAPTNPPVADAELVRITVKELNQRLQGYDRKVVTLMKQKRRTLKNRGYAYNCRVRRLQTHLQLETENMGLKREVAYLKGSLQEAQKQLSCFYSQQQQQQPPQQYNYNNNKYIDPSDVNDIAAKNLAFTPSYSANECFRNDVDIGARESNLPQDYDSIEFKI